MLADKYPDDKERSRAMGIALGGLALGVLSTGPSQTISHNLILRINNYYNN